MLTRRVRALFAASLEPSDIINVVCVASRQLGNGRPRVIAVIGEVDFDTAVVCNGSPAVVADIERAGCPKIDLI